VVPLLVLFELDVRAGRIEAGERRLLEAHGSFWPRRSWQRGLLLGGLSRARALLGDAEAAEARYEEAEGLMRELAPVGNLAEFLVERAERLAAAGDVAGAQAKLDEAEAALVEPQYPLGRIAGLRALLAAQGPAGGPTPRGAEADRN
jgi:hypothetical protein